MTPQQRAAKELIFGAAINSAIQDKRELIRASMQHFLDGGNVNGQFYFALFKLLCWVEDKTIDALTEEIRRLKDLALTVYENTQWSRIIEEMTESTVTEQKMELRSRMDAFEKHYNL